MKRLDRLVGWLAVTYGLGYLLLVLFGRPGVLFLTPLLVGVVGVAVLLIGRFSQRVHHRGLGYLAALLVVAVWSWPLWSTRRVEVLVPGEARLERGEHGQSVRLELRDGSRWVVSTDSVAALALQDGTPRPVSVVVVETRYLGRLDHRGPVAIHDRNGSYLGSITSARRERPSTRQ